MQDSALPEPGPPAASEFAVDQSPYGVFGLAGGVQEWCADAWRAEGPSHRSSTAQVPPLPTAADCEPVSHAPRRAVRGGAWNLPDRFGRAASRTAARPDRRADNLGFRVCRSIEPGED